MAPGLSAFEARRLENVANNAKLLKETAAIGAKMAKAAKPPPRPAATVPTKRKERDAAPKPAPRPTRQSARLAAGQDGATASAADLVKLEDKGFSAYDARPEKRARTSGDLKLGELLVEGSRWASGTDAFTGILVRGAAPGVRTFVKEEADDEGDEKLKELRTKMDDLELYDGWLPSDIKVTPERVYAMAFHPTKDKPVIFAGDKKGTMGLFDASQPKPQYPDDEDEEYEVPLPHVTAFEAHARTISSIYVPPADQNSVLTASYDSSIRCLDMQKQVSVQVWAPEDSSDEMPLTSIDMGLGEKDVIIFSTQYGSIGRVDRRSRGKADIYSLTEHKIGGFSVHPMAPHLIATASLDRTLKIWDLRMVKGKGDMRHPSLLGEHASRLSVSHASWSSAGQIATSSYDDTIKIYNMAESADWKPGRDLTDADMEPTHTVRHNNQTGRWVTILKPQWQRSPADGVQKFAIGNMNRFVDVYGADGKQLVQLEGEGITAVPAVAHLHPTYNWVAGGTASGKLCLWM